VWQRAAVLSTPCRILQQQLRRRKSEADQLEASEEIQAEQAVDVQPREPWENANSQVGELVVVRVSWLPPRIYVFFVGGGSKELA
jgi:hypothetical protein